MERQNEVDITLFVPCYNEEKNIVPTLETIQAALREVSLSFEILVIDDCSKDNTAKVVEEYQASHPQLRLRLHRNKKNRGLGTNYIEGSFMGLGKYYMLVNGDNAEPKEALVALLQKAGQADMIIPYFGEYEARTIGRKIVSRTYTFITQTLSNTKVKYYNGPVLHLRYNVMRHHPDTHGFGYQAELITRLIDEGATYIDVLVPNTDRQGGVTSAFRPGNFLAVVHSFLQIFLRRMRRIIIYKNQR
jgi:glycosyltransferase involved in cell wall biosynthesis